MSHPRTARLAIAAGAVLFVVAVYNTDLQAVRAAPYRVLAATLAAVALSGVWHLVRTVMWASCFHLPPPFARLARVRIAAEAFSYLTIRGVAGEPLKCLWLADEWPITEVGAAVAIEKLTYIVGTALLAAIGSAFVAATLSLSPAWTLVFKIVTLVAGAMTIVVIVWARHRSRERGLAPSAALAAGTVATFACMVAEVWAVLRVAGIEVTWTEAIAIETFSRIASFATAFVPANLGVLEASTLSATAAVGLSAGAAPLAIARRLRGLFWAAVGIALYPRRASTTSTPNDRRRNDRNGTLLYVAATDGLDRSCLARVAGLPIVERVVRAACRAGFHDVILYVGTHAGADLSQLRSLRCRIRTVGSAQALLSAIGRYDRAHAVTIVGEGVLPSVSLLEDSRSITAVAGQISDVPAGPRWPHTGVMRARIETVREWQRVIHVMTLRTPASVALPTVDDVLEGGAHLVALTHSARDREAASVMLRATAHKATDAKVARFNRRLSLPLSVALLRTPVTPNQFSIALVALGLISAWLFSRGHYETAVAAAALSLAASILDGCDGEIARLKYQDSAVGCWIETVGDYAYYVAILMGITVGAARQTGWLWLYACGNIAMAGTVVSLAALVYLRRAITDGNPEKLHAVARARFQSRPRPWTRVIWRLSFVATRAAMPYGILVLALLNALPIVIVLWAVGANVYWLSLALKLRDLISYHGQPVSEAGADR